MTDFEKLLENNFDQFGSIKLYSADQIKQVYELGQKENYTPTQVKAIIGDVLKRVAETYTFECGCDIASEIMTFDNYSDLI